VVQPPSKQLQNILFGKKLCSQRDVQGCVSRVKKLSANLPAFDSVWLDALVQTRKLTSFQAQSIESDAIEDLRIGPFVVVDRLGHGPNGDTFLARRLESKELIAIKRVWVPPEFQTQTMNSVQRIISTFSSADKTPNLVLPTACNIVEHESVRAKTGNTNQTVRGVSRPAFTPTLNVQLAVVSRYVPGLPLTQLLLRRGRFDSAVVARIGRSLLEALGILFQRKLVHGEITLDNVLLTQSGQVTLVDAGTAIAIQPEFQINAFVEPHRNDGIAPELIGTGRRASQASDLYALGCLLWHLLAGRPAFPTGDPLSKLASHQTSRIPDIREIAPETPEPLANAITWLTEPNPKKRPQHVGQVLGTVTRKAPTANSPQKNATASGKVPAASAKPVSAQPIGTPRASDKRRLAQFARSFHHPTVQKGTARRRLVSSQLALATASVFLACCGLFVWRGSGHNWPVLSFLTPSVNASESNGAANETLDANDSGLPTLQDWPEPNAAGIITLDPGAWYPAKRIVWTGQRLTIQGDKENPPRVIVTSIPLRLQATEVEIENVCIELAPSRGTLNAQAMFNRQPLTSTATPSGQAQTPLQPPRALVISESQTLDVTGCEILSALTRREGTSATSFNADQYAIAWAPLDGSDQLSGRISILDSIIAGDWSTVLLAGRSHRVKCVNSIQSGPGPLFSLHQSDRPAHDSIELNHTTLRDSGGLVSIQLQPKKPWQSRLTLQPSHCVFSLRKTANKNTVPLVAFVGNEIIPHWHEAIEINGSSSVINRGAVLAALQSTDRSISKALTNGTPRISGVVSSSVQFHGNNPFNAFDSVVTQVEANWRSESSPGVQPTSRYDFDPLPE
jgi:eukaryotic-like serine/threonine-protein kinase